MNLKKISTFSTDDFNRRNLYWTLAVVIIITSFFVLSCLYFMAPQLNFQRSLGVSSLNFGEVYTNTFMTAKFIFIVFIPFVLLPIWLWLSTLLAFGYKIIIKTMIKRTNNLNTEMFASTLESYSFTTLSSSVSQIKLFHLILSILFSLLLIISISFGIIELTNANNVKGGGSDIANDRRYCGAVDVNPIPGIIVTEGCPLFGPPLTVYYTADLSIDYVFITIFCLTCTQFLLVGIMIFINMALNVPTLNKKT